MNKPFDEYLDSRKRFNELTAELQKIINEQTRCTNDNRILITFGVIFTIINIVAMFLASCP